MPNAAYQRGMRWEDRAANDLRNLGYWVIQTRGSKTPTDLVALKAGAIPLLAQIKSPGATFGGQGWNALFELAQRCGAVPLTCEWHGLPLKPTWFRITGNHPMRSRSWPCELWV
jgi:hypothetical protein